MSALTPTPAPLTAREKPAPASTAPASPVVSVIILNYNGRRWLERCLSSLQAQTLGGQLEIIIADNQSTDGSDVLAQDLLKNIPRSQFIQHGANLGFCEGNNRAARQAQGRYLFFLNNDTWLEPECLERLLNTVEAQGADAGTPLMLNYEDDSIQSSGAAGFDLFGFFSLQTPVTDPCPLFVVGGCSYLIRNDLFRQLGGFDAAFFMYAEEYDLSWRLWLSGHHAILVPSARLHHRGAAQSNPAGGDRVVEVRTTDQKRFFANRNNLFVLLKNAQHLLLLLVPLQLLWLGAEALLLLLMTRRWSHVRHAYVEAVTECVRHRHHIRAERRRLAAMRKRGDFWMLRFFRLRLNRWDLALQLGRHGLPTVDRS